MSLLVATQIRARGEAPPPAPPKLPCPLAANRAGFTHTPARGTLNPFIKLTFFRRLEFYSITVRAFAPRRRLLSVRPSDEPARR